MTTDPPPTKKADAPLQHVPAQEAREHVGSASAEDSGAGRSDEAVASMEAFLGIVGEGREGSPDTDDSARATRAVERHFPAAQDGEGADRVSLSPFEQVNCLCAAFTGEWDAASPPAIHSYLQRVGEEARPTLLRNLLAIDVVRRRAAGEQPRARSTSNASRSSPLSCGRRSCTCPPGAAPRRRTRRSRSRGPSGRRPPAGWATTGSWGSWAAAAWAWFTRRSTCSAATASPSRRCPPWTGGRCTASSASSAPWPTSTTPTSSVYTRWRAMASSGSSPWSCWRGRISSATSAPAACWTSRVCGALAQLATGVMALHGRHVIHRDLKPSNVMVLADGRVVLLDFGLVLEVERVGASSASGEVAGTPRYMAPEQAGGGAVTAASDWYAVGVMLYEALAGRPPFDGSLYAVLRDKQQLDPPPLPAGPGVPEDLAALCMRLLARDPKQRPDAREVAGIVASQAGSGRAAPAPGGGLVGRNQHLAALQDACRTLQRQREPLTVFISGRSGEGKTTLAEHFLAPLRGEAAGRHVWPLLRPRVGPLQGAGHAYRRPEQLSAFAAGGGRGPADAGRHWRAGPGLPGPAARAGGRAGRGHTDGGSGRPAGPPAGVPGALRFTDCASAGVR